MPAARTPYSLRFAIDAALVSYWCLLFVGTHVPRSAFQQLPTRLNPGLLPDLGVHFFAYALLAALLAVAIFLRDAAPRTQLKRCWLAIGVGIPVYGFIDELTQPLTGRIFDWADWRANAAGSFSILLAVTVGLLLKQLRLNRRQS